MISDTMVMFSSACVPSIEWLQFLEMTLCILDAARGDWMKLSIFCGLTAEALERERHGASGQEIWEAVICKICTPTFLRATAQAQMMRYILISYVCTASIARVQELQVKDAAATKGPDILKQGGWIGGSLLTNSIFFNLILERPQANPE